MVETALEKLGKIADAVHAIHCMLTDSGMKWPGMTVAKLTVDLEQIVGVIDQHHELLNTEYESCHPPCPECGDAELCHYRYIGSTHWGNCGFCATKWLIGTNTSPCRGETEADRMSNYEFLMDYKSISAEDDEVFATIACAKPVDGDHWLPV